MAASTLVLSFSWENDDHLKLLASENGGDDLTILEMEENGELNIMWPHIKKTLMSYYETKIDDIGDDMLL
jgi:hypothetical protein